MRLTHERITVRTRHRFATAQGGVSTKQVIVVRLERDGVIGLGECVPSKLYGQSLESSEAALDRCAALLGDDPFAIEPILTRVLAQLGDQRAAVAALDSVLHDWAGGRLGVPVWRLLGLQRPQTRTTFTIGVAEPDEIQLKLSEALAGGFGALKVKVGTPRDEETLRIIRARFSGPLLLDVNEAWSVDEAPQRIAALAAFEPAMIEQPLPRADWAALRRLREMRVAPIFADEDCQTPQDVLRLRDAVDGVNIKFTKCGGVRVALRMIHLARALGLQVMLGCFVSSSLAIAPALAISSLVDWADLDGHLLLAEDPFTGLSRSGDLLTMSDQPGLGVSPSPASGDATS